MFWGILRIGIKDIFDVSFAVYEIKCLDLGHGGEEANNSFVGLDVGHGFLGVGGVGMDAQTLIDKAFDASL